MKVKILKEWLDDFDNDEEVFITDETEEDVNFRWYEIKLENKSTEPHLLKLGRCILE